MHIKKFIVASCPFKKVGFWGKIQLTLNLSLTEFLPTFGISQSSLDFIVGNKGCSSEGRGVMEKRKEN